MGIIRHFVAVSAFLFAIFVVGPWLFKDSPWLEFIVAIVILIPVTFLSVRRREKTLDEEFRKRWPRV